MLHKTHWLIALIAVAICSSLSAQDSTNVSFEGYAEVYYGAQQSTATQRPDFLDNHTVNGLAVNIAWLKWTVDHNRWRIVAAPMIGTYVNSNLDNEPNAVQHLYEASIGYRLGGGANSRIDAGVMPSHIGLESNFGRNNLNLTRSLLAENTPYYECGVRWSGTTENGLSWAVLVLNGWQRIAVADDQIRPNFGMQLQHDNKKGRVLNYSNYLGSINGRYSVYHNFYATQKIASNWFINAEFNYEAMERSKDFIGGSLALGKQLFHDWTVAGRIEQVRDVNNTYFATRTTPAQINPGGWSANIDYQPHKAIKCRIEARRLWSVNREPQEDLALYAPEWLYTAACCISF
jgi:hypothetical protein